VDLAYVGSNGHFLGAAPGDSGPTKLIPGTLFWQPTPVFSHDGQHYGRSGHCPGLGSSVLEFRGFDLSDAAAVPAVLRYLRPWGNVGNSNYNSLQIVGRKTLSHGLIADVNYTIQKGFDDLSYRTAYRSEKPRRPFPLMS